MNGRRGRLPETAAFPSLELNRECVIGGKPSVPAGLGDEMVNSGHDTAKVVLEAFRYYNMNSGQWLIPGNFEAWMEISPHERSVDRVENGIRQGIQLGWFETDENGFVTLMPKGFEAMKQRTE